MANADNSVKEVTDYIENCLSKGIDEKKIISTLISAGWPKEKIELALDGLKKTDTGKHRIAEIAEDIMDKDLVTAEVTSSIGKVIELLKNRDSGYVLLLDKGLPAGIVTGSDVVKNLERGTINIELSCRQIMTAPVKCCNYDETVLDVCTKMKLEEVERIPVLKNGKLAGIITSSALVDFMSYG